MGQAIPPISAIINRFELARGSLLLLPKWERGLRPWCLKMVCPLFKPSGLIWKLHFWNQETKLHYLHYQFCQYIDFHLDSISSPVWATSNDFLWTRNPHISWFHKNNKIPHRFIIFLSESSSSQCAILYFSLHNGPQNYNNHTIWNMWRTLVCR